MHALRAHMAERILKGYADLIREARIDFIGEAGRVVRLVRNEGNPQRFGCDGHRHAHKAAFAEHDIRLDGADDPFRLGDASDYAKGVRNVFPRKIAAQLAGGYRVVCHARTAFDHAALDAVLRSDIMDVAPFREKLWEERDVGRDMSGGTAAREQDRFFHCKPFAWEHGSSRIICLKRK